MLFRRTSMKPPIEVFPLIIPLLGALGFASYSGYKSLKKSDVNLSKQDRTNFHKQLNK